jgi:hypothetical protein
MLLSNCTTVERVEKLSEEGAEYSRICERATAVAALGRDRTEVGERRLVTIRALLAAAPVVHRRASISKFV